MSLYLHSLIKGYSTISPNFDVFVPNFVTISAGNAFMFQNKP